MFGPNIDHPGHHHTLFSWTRRSNYPVPFKCNGCTQDVEPEGFYCPEEGCEFYLDYTCAYFGHASVNKPEHQAFYSYLGFICSHNFKQNQLLLSQYEFQHSLHPYENHTM
ncbi:hypothetical protein FEM48_Zijuj10G0011700 [Ziziphus jujuba var. spinosa]|uniref:DC1 domain-containing protein n=1 Tax=Ziziphus jujuba var. spinosa TaxID=714518 RepID=A0A978UKE4_ZIZJJ|nr:hypothetical protein FEM48_Zijuj10G0011700 [Ziziphus jujuba var. spinosa]